MRLTVQSLFDNYGTALGLLQTEASKGMEQKIEVSHVQRPGLALAGYVKRREDSRILIFGRIEIEYLQEVSSEILRERLLGVITAKTPTVIVSRGKQPPQELLSICQEFKVPLLCTQMGSMELMQKLSKILNEAFIPTTSLHGTFVEIFGVGVLIRGESSVGKSEAALGLIEKRHRLISDDVVYISKKESGMLIGTGSDLNRHLIELRGLGIINVAHLYGAVSVKKEMQIDLVVNLEEWDESQYYDRLGLEQEFIEILDEKLPLYIQPVKPGRDIVLLIETIVLNQRLKEMGCHAAKEFKLKLIESIASRKNLDREI